MKNFLPVFLLVIISIASCRKDDAIETIPPVTVSQEPAKVTDYYPLTVGSYWIYHVYNIDTNLIEHYMANDTVRILGDTILNGRRCTWIKKQYFGSPSYYNWFVADSLDYIIHYDGHRLFSSTNFTDTLLTEIYPNYKRDYYYMTERGSIVSVPAGIFKTIDRDHITYFDLPNYPYQNPRTAIKYHSKNVGLVKERNYYDMSPEWMERRLVQYHIAP